MPCRTPKDVEKAEGEESVVIKRRKYEGYVGPNGERYEQVTTEVGQVSWLRLFYDGDEA